MKLVLTLMICLLSSTAIAAFNELECAGDVGQKSINLEVEQPFPSSGVFKRVNLSVSTNSTVQSFNYTATTSRFGLRNILYQGSGLRIEVDLWPDNVPRWGGNYRAILNSSDLNDGSTVNLYCQFPNAN